MVTSSISSSSIFSSSAAVVAGVLGFCITPPSVATDSMTWPSLYMPDFSLMVSLILSTVSVGVYSVSPNRNSCSFTTFDSRVAGTTQSPLPLITASPLCQGKPPVSAILYLVIFCAMETISLKLILVAT